MIADIPLLGKTTGVHPGSYDLVVVEIGFAQIWRGVTRGTFSMIELFRLSWQQTPAEIHRGRSRSSRVGNTVGYDSGHSLASPWGDSEGGEKVKERCNGKKSETVAQGYLQATSSGKSNRGW